MIEVNTYALLMFLKKIVAINDEAFIRCRKRSIAVYQVDCAHVAFIDEKLSVIGEGDDDKFTIRVKELYKALKTIKLPSKTLKDTDTIIIDTKSKENVISIKHPTLTITTPIIDDEDAITRLKNGQKTANNLRKILKETPVAVATVSTKRLRTFINAFKSCMRKKVKYSYWGEAIRFEFTRGEGEKHNAMTLKMCYADEILTNVESTIANEDIHITDEFDDEKGVFTAMYAIDYIESILKSLNCKTVEMRFRVDFPLRIAFQENHIIGEFVLAPRLESE